MQRISLFILAALLMVGTLFGQTTDDLVEQARQAIATFDLKGADAKYKDAMNGTADEDDYAVIRKEWEVLEGINVLLSDGRRAIDGQNYSGALSKYEAAIAAMENTESDIWNKTKAEALYSMGMVYYRQENPVEASREFRSAMVYDPSAEKYSKAVQMVRNKYYSEGHKLYKRKDYQGAEDQYSLAVQIDPSFSSAYYMLAVIQKKDGRLDDAEKNYRNAVENEETHYKSWYGLGQIYADRGKDNQAVQMYLKSIAVNPEYEKAHYALAKVYENQKKTDHAITSLKTAIRLDRKYTLAYELLGKIYIDSERYEDAVALLAPLAGPATSYKTYYRLAHGQNQLEKYAKALEAANKSLSKKSNWAPALIEKGNALAGLGRKSEAIASFKAAARDARWKSVAEYRIAELTKWEGKG